MVFKSLSGFTQVEDLEDLEIIQIINQRNQDLIDASKIPSDTVENQFISQPIMFVENEKIEAGNLMQGVLDTLQIEIWNKGTEDLLIFSVIPDCNCMAPKWPNQPLKAGEKDWITIVNDTKEDLGKFLKTITIIHNAGEGYTFVEIVGFVTQKL